MAMKRRMLGIGAGCALLLLGAIHANSVEADDWEFSVAPYVWAAGLEGDVTFRNLKTDVDVSFSDILDNLDIAALGHAELRKDRLSLFVDAIYLKMGADATVPVSIGPITRGIGVDAESEVIIGEFGAFYRVADWVLGDGEDVDRTLSLEVLGGGRYVSLEHEFDLTLALPFLGATFSRTVTLSDDWIDPIVGLRAVGDLGHGFALRVRGDVGGFGVGSDFTWNALGLIAYDVTDSVTVGAGYRALYFDYDDGSGINAVAYDVTMHGPLFGAEFRF